MSYAQRSAHSILVVFTYKHAQNVPEFGHVERLEDLTLVACTVTVESEHSKGPLKVFLSKSDAGTMGTWAPIRPLPPKKRRVKMCMMWASGFESTARLAGRTVRSAQRL